VTASPSRHAYAIELARAGERGQARLLFGHIVRQHPDDADAWLWLSELADALDEQIHALENAQRGAALAGGQGGTLQERLNAIRGALALQMPAPGFRA
jgi:hypothetical protein